MTLHAVRRWIEGVLTLLAVLSLWPWVLGWPHPAWRILMYVMLAVMAVLFLLNVVRLWRMGHGRAGDGNGP